MTINTNAVTAVVTQKSLSVTYPCSDALVGHNYRIPATEYQTRPTISKSKNIIPPMAFKLFNLSLKLEDFFFISNS